MWPPGKTMNSVLANEDTTPLCQRNFRLTKDSFTGLTKSMLIFNKNPSTVASSSAFSSTFACPVSTTNNVASCSLITTTRCYIPTTFFIVASVTIPSSSSTTTTTDSFSTTTNTISFRLVKKLMNMLDLPFVLIDSLGELSLGLANCKGGEKNRKLF
ncbi:hypothetical protein OIU85_026708 [Salix viminalis]|uniref:Uncharacterized protein n=1 Tax=Salix viminalis TaxID=40686 RepID=A0A9Q0YYY1_SALVM|nr:hypothetical protein OIU85_026708 [Salix viminalis]